MIGANSLVNKLLAKVGQPLHNLGNIELVVARLLRYVPALEGRDTVVTGVDLVEKMTVACYLTCRISAAPIKCGYVKSHIDVHPALGRLGEDKACEVVGVLGTEVTRWIDRATVEAAAYENKRIDAYPLHIVEITAPLSPCPIGGWDVVGDLIYKSTCDRAFHNSILR